MPLTVIVPAAICLIAVWAVYTYNFLVHARAKVRKGMRGVDVQLKLRHDLVPSLNEVVRAHADHENEALRSAAAQRSRAIKARRTKDVETEENALAAEISRLLAVAQEYPRLKAEPKFVRISGELSALDEEIRAALELYNANVEFYNSRSRRIPNSLVAMWLKPKSFTCIRLDPLELDAGLTRVGEFAA